MPKAGFERWNELALARGDKVLLIRVMRLRSSLRQLDPAITAQRRWLLRMALVSLMS